MLTITLVGRAFITAASLMLAEGAQITDVSKLLGHSFAENRRKAVASSSGRQAGNDD